MKTARNTGERWEGDHVIGRWKLLGAGRDRMLSQGNDDQVDT